MITYSGNCDEFKTTITEFNQALNIFLKPTVRKTIKERIVLNLIMRLTSIAERAEAEYLDWYNQQCPDALNPSCKGLIHRRQLLNACDALIEKIKNNQINIGQDVFDMLKEHRAISEKLIISFENEINRASGITALRVIEVGAALMAVGGLALSGILVAGAGITYGYGCAISCCAAKTTGASMAALGGKSAIVGVTAGGVSRVSSAAVAASEPDNLRVFAPGHQ